MVINKIIFKNIILLMAVLAVIIMGNFVRMKVIGQTGGGTSIGNNLFIDGDVMIGQSIINGQTMEKIYDGTSGTIPLELLPI